MTVNYIEIQGTSGATSRAQDIIDKIATEIAALSNHWSVVEDGYTGQTNFYRTVLKCASTGSGLSTDFYVVLFTMPTYAHYQNKLYITICEDYNTTTHTLTYPAIANHPTDSECRGTHTPTELAVSCNNWDLDTNVPAGVIGPANGDLVGVFVYDDGIWFSSRNERISSVPGVYAGAFISSVTSPATNDPVPLCVAFMGQPGITETVGGINCTSTSHTTSSSSVAQVFRVVYTRWAMNPSTSAIANNDEFYKSGYAGSLTPNQLFLPFSASSAPQAGNLDPYSGNTGFPSAPYVMYSYQKVFFAADPDDPNYRSNSVGVIRGTLPYVLSGPSANWGDTLTIGNEVYMKIDDLSADKVWVLKEIVT